MCVGGSVSMEITSGNFGVVLRVVYGKKKGKQSHAVQLKTEKSKLKSRYRWEESDEVIEGDVEVACRKENEVFLI